MVSTIFVLCETFVDVSICHTRDNPFDAVIRRRNAPDAELFTWLDPYVSYKL